MSEQSNKTKQFLTDDFAVSMEQLDEYIEACQLEKHKNEYSPEEVNLLCKYHALSTDSKDKKDLLDNYQEALDEGKSVAAALDETVALIDATPTSEDETQTDEAQTPTDDDETPSPSSPYVTEKTTLFELLTLAQDLTGKPMTLSRAIEFLKACNLPEKQEYDPTSANRFLEVANRVINQGESIGEVASENGVTSSPLSWMNEAVAQNASDVNEVIGERRDSLNAQLVNTYEATYLRQVAESFRNGDLDRAYQRAKARRLAQQESPFDRAIRELREANGQFGYSGDAYTIETSSVPASEQAQLPQGETED